MPESSRLAKQDSHSHSAVSNKIQNPRRENAGYLSGTERNLGDSARQIKSRINGEVGDFWKDAEVITRPLPATGCQQIRQRVSIAPVVGNDRSIRKGAEHCAWATSAVITTKTKLIQALARDVSWWCRPFYARRLRGEVNCYFRSSKIASTVAEQEVNTAAPEQGSR